MTEIVVAVRNGLAQAPDGSNHRLVRGRTLADARHPLAQNHPELFGPYSIDLPYDGPDAESGSLAAGEVSGELVGELADARSAAESYRTQLAAIAEGLHERGLVPADLDTEREGWLAALVFAVIDAPPAGTEASAAALPETVVGKPEALPKAPRRRTPRPAPTNA